MKVSVGITVTTSLTVQVDDDLDPKSDDFEVAVNNAILERLPLEMELQTIDVMQPEGRPAVWTGCEEEE